jgi:hypothetical protein
MHFLSIVTPQPSVTTKRALKGLGKQADEYIDDGGSYESISSAYIHKDKIGHCIM